MLYFGQGIVKTADDFGALGAWPTHPELLDWLALDFQQHGGDIKRSDQANRHVRGLSPIVQGNARAAATRSVQPAPRPPGPFPPRRRVRARQRPGDQRPAWCSKIGGPSVKPYQPAGYWRYLNFPTREWANDKGENQYRRGLYTYWQRTFLQPSLLAFDASTREECTVERPRSNTPQQALVLLNDPTYVEASRVFAEKIVQIERARRRSASTSLFGWRCSGTRTPTKSAS